MPLTLTERFHIWRALHKHDGTKDDRFAWEKKPAKPTSRAQVLAEQARAAFNLMDCGECGATVAKSATHEQHFSKCSQNKRNRRSAELAEAQRDILNTATNLRLLEEYKNELRANGTPVLPPPDPAVITREELFSAHKTIIPSDCEYVNIKDGTGQIVARYRVTA